MNIVCINPSSRKFDSAYAGLFNVYIQALLLTWLSLWLTKRAFGVKKIHSGDYIYMISFLCRQDHYPFGQHFCFDMNNNDIASLYINRLE